MKTTISAGGIKYLVLNTVAIERNKTRSAHKCAPVGRVIVVEDGRIAAIHESNHIVVNGPVELSYKPHAFLTGRPRDDMRAAYMTTAEVVIGEDAEPELAAQVPDADKAPTTDAKPKKPARVTNVKTQE
jgi:hypothetical protein